MADQAAYQGKANLELMDEAVNYQRFLLNTVLGPAQQGMTILDFGAGHGSFALALAARGHRVVCVESDREYAEHLRGNGLLCHPDLAPVADGSIDYLYSLNVLEHVEDDAALLRMWHRKIRPGGRLLLYVPAFMLLFSSMDRVVGHVRRYHLAELRQLLRAEGFRILDAGHVDSIGFIGMLLMRLLDKDDGRIRRSTLILFDRVFFPISRLMDRITRRWFGKNLLILAERP